MIKSIKVPEKQKAVSKSWFLAISMAICLFTKNQLFAQIPLREIYLPQGAETKRGGADHLYFSITNNSWLDAPEEIKVRMYSPGIDAFLTKDFWIKPSIFSIASGIAISSYNVHSNAKFTNCQNSYGTTLSCLKILPLKYEYKKNKISVNYLDIPLEIRLKRTFNKPLRIYTGFKFGYLFNVHDKTIDDTGKYKNLNLKGFNKWRYGGYLIVGYHQFNFYGFYSLTPLLDKNANNQIIPVSIGLTFFII